ncbi:MAG: hypothetical protein HZC19_01895 [Candidatus Omnitrophica bacterium]|nr:hypothetical protein [Candidatus Omnitrophota bacterium]
MRKRVFGIISLLLAFCFLVASISYAAEKGTAGGKVKNFWRRLFNYPAKVAEESVATVSNTGKKGTEVIATEVKTVGEVTSGDIAKTKELVTEPITGAAETAVQAVESTVKIPVEAAKEEPAPAAPENK